MNHADAAATLAVERYLLGEMTDNERPAFEEHYFGCVECADACAKARSSRPTAKGGLRGHSFSLAKAGLPAYSSS
jgi:hypothetical protein